MQREKLNKKVLMSGKPIFNSISLDNIIVDSIKVTDTDTNITYDYEDTDGEIPDFLPYQDEFMGERSIYELPWWERNDISTYDNFALDDEELKSEFLKTTSICPVSPLAGLFP